MANRITQKQLDNLCEYLNTILGRPVDPWRNVDGKLVANVGTFYIDSAYGGVKLVEMDNEHGGVRNVFGIGYVPRR